MDEFYELDKSPQYDVEAIRRKKKIQKRKKKKRRIKLILLCILIIGSITGAGLSPFFNVVDIKVEDTPHYTGEEIMAYIQSVKGLNGFKAVGMDFVDLNRAIRLRFGATEDKLSKVLPYADTVKVSYYPPSSIKVKVTEREPFAVVKNGNKMLLIDKTGYILEEINENKNKYIQINGLENIKTLPGGYFCDNYSEVMSTAVNVISVLSDIDSNEDNKIVPLINSINLSDVRRVKLFIDSRLVVVLGDVRSEDILRYRGNYLKQLIFKYISKKDTGTIDFTMGEDPRFIPNKLN